MIELVPIKAYRIDVSSVADIHRERLKVVFEDGHELYFRYDSASVSMHVDMNDPLGSALGDGRKLREILFGHFRTKRYDRSRGQRFADAIHKFFDVHFSPRYDKWTVQRLFDEFVIEFTLGNEFADCGLAEGRYLEVLYGTPYNDPLVIHVPWGRVVSFENTTLQPVPAKPGVPSFV